jgi:hypothetical protein
MPWRMRALMIGFWIIPALIATSGFTVVPSFYNPDLSLPAIFVAQLIIWLSWGGWSLLISAVIDRVPFERDRWWRAVLAHVPLCALVVSAQIVIMFIVLDVTGISGRRSVVSAALTDWVGIAPPLPPDVAPIGLNSVFALGVRGYGDSLLMVYVAVVGTLTALRWYEEWRTAQVQAAQMREDLTRAQLQALQAQLNPHFLFNALNAVVTLIKRDPAAAERTTIRLADLLRATLTVGDETTIALAQELELTSRYLEIEQVRFPDRLRVEWQIPEHVRELSVPPFTLQPLVENAVRHAVSRNPDGGTITVMASRTPSVLTLTVRDEGAGSDNDLARNNGTGSALRNLRSRLQRAYGERASLDMRERPEGGTDVVVQLPITPRRES